MSILAGFMVPHPPLIVPEVGHGDEREIQATIDAYKKVAAEIAELAPETIVVISPHATAYMDYNHISPGAGAKGSFSQFGAPQVKLEREYDTELVRAFCAEIAADRELRAGTEGERDRDLDHGTLVPLYFVNAVYPAYKLVRLGISYEPLVKQYRLGICLRDAVEKLGRRVVIIASGDLSHHLNKKSPYGFNPAGPRYDEKIMQTMGSASFLDLLLYSPKLCKEAGECGHRSFTIMAGAFDGYAVATECLSHEGPFGVGYGVCTFRNIGRDARREFLPQYLRAKEQLGKAREAAEDPYVKLARQSLEHYVRTGKKLSLPENLPREMLQQRAGAFVSLKKDGVLRGCIGTIGPTRDNLALEILNNAISAGFHDPRFLEVRKEELADIVYSVDVLGPIEPISSPRELDVKRYGVIVDKGSRSGLLLPNLEGIDTVEQQIEIARRKAGIGEQETGVTLSRFEVIRHRQEEE